MLADAAMLTRALRCPWERACVQCVHVNVNAGSEEDITGHLGLKQGVNDIALS